MSSPIIVLPTASPRVSAQSEVGPQAAPAESLVLLPYLSTPEGTARLVSLPMLGLVQEDGIEVPALETRHLRHTLSGWARQGRLWRIDPLDGRAYPFSAMTVFEPLAMMQQARLALSCEQPSGGLAPSAPNATVSAEPQALRIAVLPLQHYREAAQEVLSTFDRGYADERGAKPLRGPRSRRIERLLNLTFEDLRWLRRAERLVCAQCAEHERPAACAGVRCSLHSAAARYLRRHVADAAAWEPLLAEARRHEGLLHRLVELDGFMDSSLAAEFLVPIPDA